VTHGLYDPEWHEKKDRASKLCFEVGQAVATKQGGHSQDIADWLSWNCQRVAQQLSPYPLRKAAALMSSLSERDDDALEARQWDRIKRTPLAHLPAVFGLVFVGLGFWVRESAAPMAQIGSVVCWIFGGLFILPSIADLLDKLRGRD
jgi:predicted membrane metal-binding protein